uniref:Uncharacterized protein n=1 Tax=Timema shepardi TaxID=629360 RepID=A0A7R9BAJ5_TIMSH|nr:unnamed protein product [Timema shepardi]
MDDEPHLLLLDAFSCLTNQSQETIANTPSVSISATLHAAILAQTDIICFIVFCNGGSDVMKVVGWGFGIGAYTCMLFSGQVGEGGIGANTCMVFSGQVGEVRGGDECVAEGGATVVGAVSESLDEILEQAVQKCRG